MNKLLSMFTDRAMGVVALGLLFFVIITGGDPNKLQALWADMGFVAPTLVALGIRRMAYKLNVVTPTHKLGPKERAHRELVLIGCDSFIIAAGMVGSIIV